MRVAFVSTLDIAPWGGCEALWFETARLALQEKHEVFASTYYWKEKTGLIAELGHLGAQTHFRERHTRSLPIRLFRRIRNVFFRESSEVSALKKFDPDVLVINQAGSFDVLHNTKLMAYLLTTSKPYYIICHNYREDLVLTEQKRNTLLQLFGKSKFNYMICRSQLQTVMKQLAYRLPNAGLISNPVNIRQTGPLDFPSFHKVQFACVASLHVDRKGQDILFEVLSSEKWKSRNWQLNIYGTGPDKQYLDRLVAYFGLENNIVFKGHVKDIDAVWRSNHVLLLPSRIETGPMVLTEAMLCGRPVVTTPVGRVPEIIQDGYNGYVAEAATVPLFDAALERAWQNKEQWPAIGQQAYQSAQAHVDFNAPRTFLKILTERNRTV